MSILLTGSKGFTGKFLESILTSKHDVHPLESNLLDIESLNRELDRIKPSVIFHLAGVAVTHDTPSGLLYDVNTIGVHNLLQSVINTSNLQTKVFLVSTASVYSTHEPDVIFTESSDISLGSHYATSKYCAELIARQYASMLDITILRPFNYTGVGQTDNFIIPKLVNAYKNNIDSIKVGNLNVVREFNDVRWIAEVYYELICHRAQDIPLINISSGVGVELFSAIEFLSNYSQHKVELVVDSSFTRENDPISVVGDNSYLRSIIGEKATSRYDFLDTLKWMYNEC